MAAPLANRGISPARAPPHRPPSLEEEEIEGLDEIIAPELTTPERPVRVQRPSQRSSMRSSRFAQLSQQEEFGLSEVSSRQISSQMNTYSQEQYGSDYLETARQERAEDEEERHVSNAESKIFEYVTQLYIFSYLILFSILGVLTRLGVQWLTFYPGAPVVIPNLWANVGGTLLVGFLAEERQLFRAGCDAKAWEKVTRLRTQRSNTDITPERKISQNEKETYAASKKVVPLYIALAVGYCGSFTSFSTFILDMFFALDNDLPTPRNHPTDILQSTPLSSTVPRSRGDTFMAILAVVFLTVGLCQSALLVGTHLARGLDRILPTIPLPLSRHFIDPFAAVLGWGCWIGAIIMAVWPPDRPGGPQGHGTWYAEQWRGEVILALVFAPVGCLLRFWLAIKLNPRVRWFPLGTFTANVFGTMIIGMCYDLQHVPLSSMGATRLPGGGHTGCEVLQGVQDGFCGALTTVSTWAIELRTLRTRHAWFYGMISTLVCFSSLIVITGSVRWTAGFWSGACIVSRAA